MAILEILEYPDPRLYKIAAPVSTIDTTIQELIKNMAETMYAAPGVGLAAPQINVHKQIIVIDISDTQDQLYTFINPIITAFSGEAENEEGCLSVPGVFEKVRRAAQITVEALDISGTPFTVNAEGMLAVCIQHEIDHLNGKIFVEYLSRLKQGRIRNKFKKQQRKAKE